MACFGRFIPDRSCAARAPIVTRTTTRTRTRTRTRTVGSVMLAIRGNRGPFPFKCAWLVNVVGRRHDQPLRHGIRIGFGVAIAIAIEKA